MKKLQLVIAALVFAGMVADSASSEARVRDPISRMTSPERGFFESRSSGSSARSSSYARSGARVSTPAYVARPAAVSQGAVVTREVVPAPVAQPRAVQPRTRYIRVR